MNVNDRDEQQAWELLGRHEGVKPSLGFADRTMRRLHEEPARRFWELTVWRWVLAGGCAAVMVAGGMTCRQARHNAAVAAAAHHESFEDYDVIAALDQLEAKSKL